MTDLARIPWYFFHIGQYFTDVGTCNNSHFRNIPDIQIYIAEVRTKKYTVADFQNEISRISQLGFPTEFHFAKIPRKRSETVPLFFDLNC
jgi:hypothetical protein